MTLACIECSQNSHGFSEDPNDYSTPQIANQSDPQAAASRNGGLKARADFFASSAEVELLSPIYTPLHTSPHLILPLCQIDYELNLNSESFVLQSAEANPETKYSLRITEAALLVKKCKLISSLRIAHAALLAKTPAQYPVVNWKCRTYQIPTGSYGFSLPDGKPAYLCARIRGEISGFPLFVVFNMWTLPRILVVGFTKTVAAEGDWTENPFFFQNLSTKSVSLTVSDKRIPHSVWEISPQNNLALLQYMESLHGAGLVGGGATVAPTIFNRKNFRNLFLLFFDLTKNGDVRSNFLNAMDSARNVQLQGSFSAATGDAITLFAFGFFQNTIEINSSYEPIVPY